MRIKALWVDDEWKDYPDFPLNALQYEIDMVCVSNKKEAEQILEEESFDVAILDANFKKDKDDPVENKKADWLISLNHHIKNRHKEVEVFVLTGNLYKYENDKREMIEGMFGDRLVIKGPEDYKLLEDIRKWYDNKPNNKIKNEHKQVFRLLQGQAEEKMLDLIKQKDNNEKIIFNHIRIVLEFALNSYIEKGYAPKCLSPGGVLYFMNSTRGIEIKLKNNQKKEIQGPQYKVDANYRFPETINSVAITLWNIQRAGSHSRKTNPDKRKKKPFYQNDPEKILSEKSIQGLVHFLCDFLTYTQDFFDLNNPTKKWEETSVGDLNSFLVKNLDPQLIRDLRSNCNEGDKLLQILDNCENESQPPTRFNPL